MASSASVIVGPALLEEKEREKKVNELNERRLLPSSPQLCGLFIFITVGGFVTATDGLEMSIISMFLGFSSDDWCI